MNLVHTIKAFVILICLIMTISIGAQKSNKNFTTIKNLLYQQQEDWNNADIDAFMEVYWKSEELQFGGATGITKGWQNTLDNYKTRYPDKAAMGTLRFDIKDLTQHSRKVISLTGSWDLARDSGDIGGHFILIWRKIKRQWRIVADHTSARP